MDKKDYYEVLGVSRNATDAELKSAYRKLSMQTHPDRQAGKSDAEKKVAEEKFKAVNEAYSVLSDKEKRARYDQFGADDVNQNGGFGGVDPFEFFRHMSGGFGFNGGDDSTMHSHFSSPQPDFDSPENGADVQTAFDVTFKEIIFGCTKELDFDLDKECPTCKGRGIKDGSKPVKCAKCHGRGSISQIQRMGPAVMQRIITCPHCNGSGYAVDHCETCHGEGRVHASRHVKIKIPAGHPDGRRLKLKGCGRCGIRGGKDGDMYLVIRSGSSDLFVRDGDTIWLKTYISPAIASLGGKIEVPTLYGYKKLNIEPGTSSGARLRIPGGGVKSSDRKTGDMIVEVEIEPYSALTDSQRKMLTEFQKTETPASTPKASELKRMAEAFYH